MLSVLNTTLNKDYSILFYSILLVMNMIDTAHCFDDWYHDKLCDYCKYETVIKLI